MSNDSLAKRIARLAALFAIFALTSNGFVLWWQTRENVNQALDQHLAAYNDFLLTATRFVNGQLEFRDPDGTLAAIPRYWQITSKNGPRFASSKMTVTVPVEDDPNIATVRKDFEVDGHRVTAVQNTYTFPKGQRVTFLTGLDREVADEYVRDTWKNYLRLLLPVAILAALVLLICGMALLRIITRPLHALQKDVESVRSGKSCELSELYPLEIRNLTSSLNALLKQDAVKVKRQREAMTNLAHSLRTPLTVIANDASTSLVREKVRDILQLLDRVLVRAQSGSSSAALVASAPVRKVAEKVVQSYAKLYQKQGLVNIDTEIEFTGDEADLYEMLGNAIENAGRYGRSTFSVSVEDSSVVIDDDGPGIPQERYESVLRRGVRLDESQPGYGIGLAVVAELVASYGGSVHLCESPLGGLRVSFELPLRRHKSR